jgi:hypothetical protein
MKDFPQASRVRDLLWFAVQEPLHFACLLVTTFFPYANRALRVFEKFLGVL